MNWTILNVSIPVHDLDKSKEFYEMLLGITEDQEELYQPLFQNEESVFLGDKGFGLRLFKPKPDLLVSDNIQSRRSFVTLLVESIDHIQRNLEVKNIKFKINDFSNDKPIKRIFVYFILNTSIEFLFTIYYFCSTTIFVIYYNNFIDFMEFY